MDLFRCRGRYGLWFTHYFIAWSGWCVEHEVWVTGLPTEENA